VVRGVGCARREFTVCAALRCPRTSLNRAERDRHQGGERAALTAAPALLYIVSGHSLRQPWLAPPVDQDGPGGPGLDGPCALIVFR